MEYTSNSFDIINNYNKYNINIIVDKKTGYYNISNALNKINNLHKNDKNWIEFSNTNIVYDWLNDDLNKSCIRCIKYKFKIRKLAYNLKKNIDNNYVGLYVHKTIFNHILSLIDINYYIQLLKYEDIIDNNEIWITI